MNVTQADRLLDLVAAQTYATQAMQAARKTAFLDPDTRLR